MFYPAVQGSSIYYSHILIYATPMTSYTLLADLNAQTQTIIFSYQENSTQNPDPAWFIDASANHLISKGGCGGYGTMDLCHFLLPLPSTPEMLIEDSYGSHNSIWGDIAVWFTLGSMDDDIRAYNFASEQFIEVTDDPETQLYPRIHENLVVYQDHKLGDSDGMGNWNHAAIFMYNLTTTETTQITSGEWISAHPRLPTAVFTEFGVKCRK